MTQEVSASTSRKMFSVREETFGYTFFDKTKLRHQLVKKEDLGIVLTNNHIAMNDCDVLPITRKDVRLDILYSPVRIYYETTLGCLLRCRACFNSSGVPRSDELSTPELIKSLSDIREANVMDLRFTGGELTGRSDWFLMLKTAKELGFGVSCNTNGIYKEPNVPEKFAEADIDQVTVSIDGRRENHEKNRGIGTFDKTVESLKRMNAAGVKLRINTLITKASLGDARYMAELATECGVTEINYFITRFVGRGRNFSSAELVTFEEFYRMSLEAETLRAEFPNLNIIHFEGATIQNSSRSGTFDQFGLRIGPPDGTTRFNILSNGDLYAGGYIPYVDQSFRLGNIKKDNIVDIWQNNKKLEEFRDISSRLEIHCTKCGEYENRCPGPNFELELLRRKNPEIKNPYCFYGNGPSLLNLMK